MVVKMVVKKEHPDLHRHGLRPPWERAAAERVMAFAWSFARVIRRSTVAPDLVSADGAASRRPAISLSKRNRGAADGRLSQAATCVGDNTHMSSR